MKLLKNSGLGFIIAKNYRVLKPDELTDKMPDGFIIAKNYRVLKPQQRS